MSKPNYYNALLELVPNAECGVTTKGDISTVTWLDSREQPTDENVKIKLSQMIAEWEKLQYQRDRVYPSIGDQLDMLYHAIDAGKVNKTSDFYKALKAVKDANPKS